MSALGVTSTRTGHWHVMGTVSVTIPQPIDDVWRAIVDAERYPQWLLGAQEVDAPPQWPAIGSSFSHRIGAGPVRTPGSTTVRERVEGRTFGLEAGMGWMGRSDVRFELEPRGVGETVVTMRETPAEGLVHFASRVTGPLVERSMDRRNEASLRKLRALLLGRD
jgi:uncharacterized protein YndB with AHSA1/START domain